MAALPQPLNPRNPQKWCYTWEALGHIPTLRLFLFCQEVNPSDRCHNLNADLLPDRSLLIISWIQGAGSRVKVALKVPVPKVLIDFESPMDVSARKDHIEVKLVLVLPVDHPIVLGFRADVKDNADCRDVAAKDERLLRSLDSDSRLLSAGEVHLYCRACSAKLTRNSLRNFVNLPSVDWKEIADNWFGACCCSFGGISEKLSNKYIDKLALTKGTCLLDPAAVIVCKDDLEGYEFSDEKWHSECDISHADSGHLTKIVKDLGNPALEDVCNGGITERIGKPLRYVPGGDEALEKSLENSTLQMHLPTCNNESAQVSLQSTDDIGVSHLSLLETHHDGIDSMLKINTSQYTSNLTCHQLQQDSTVESHCCFSGNQLHNEMAETTKPTSMKKPVMKAGQGLVHIGSLASNFMTRTWNRAKDIIWVEFSCRNCSSLLGSYPSFEYVNTPIDGGLRLFKFCISTSPSNSKMDIFRTYSFQRVFMNTLLESAADELTYRTLLRDLNSNLPMLGLVLVNSKVWCISGNCLENDVVDPISELDLQPFAKVLFSDFTTEAIGNSRSLEEWSGSHHADEVYMLSSQIKELIESLNASQAKLPRSCSELQGMSVSFVER